jgi:putative FmdB family regulatory protein
MPTYEYLCKQCSHRFEIVQKMTDKPLSICPECGGTIRRVLYPAGIVFKGSGFYKTDHANGSSASENGHTPKSDGAEPAKTGETGAAAPSESKSADNAGSGGTGAKAGESKVAAEAK